MSFKNALLVPILLAFTVLSADSATTPSKGTVIGTTIKDAITAAFPGISSIITAIWPNRDQKKKATDAEEATKNLKSSSTDAQKALGKVADDLDVVTTFLANCIVAENQVIAMRTLLLGPSPASPETKANIRHAWNLAKGRIQKLKAAGAEIDKLDDPNTKVVLRAVVEANDGMIQNVDGELDNPSHLGTDLDTLDGQLSAVNALSGEIIGSVAFGLRSLKSAAGGAQSLGDMSEREKSAHQDFVQALKSRYPNLQL